MKLPTGRLQNHDFEEWWKRALSITSGQVRLLTKQAAWTQIQGWRQVYARALHERTGRWVLGDHEWHVMSYGYAVHVASAVAEAHYLELRSETCYLVYLEQCSVPMCEITHGTLPSLQTLYEISAPESGTCDIYLFPPDYAWTFIITHEPGIGPFFSRAEWQP